MKIGIQLYSVTDDVREDLEGTLRALKQIGYDCIEPCGLGGKTPEEYKALCDEIGLEICSVHIGESEWDEPAFEIVERYARLGCRDIVIPCPKALSWPGQPKFLEFKEFIAEFAKEVKALGARAHYHNHAPDTLKINSRTALDTILDAPELHPEFDCGWLEASGQSAVDFIERYAGRVKMLHIRDYWQSSRKTRVNMQYTQDGQTVLNYQCVGEDFDPRPLGYGLLPMREVVRAAKAAGVTHLIYENDPDGGSFFGMTPIEAAKSSYLYLKSCVDELENN